MTVAMLSVTCRTFILCATWWLEVMICMSFCFVMSKKESMTRSGSCVECLLLGSPSRRPITTVCSSDSRTDMSSLVNKTRGLEAFGNWTGVLYRPVTIVSRSQDCTRLTRNWIVSGSLLWTCRLPVSPATVSTLTSKGRGHKVMYSAVSLCVPIGNGLALSLPLSNFSLRQSFFPYSSICLFSFPLPSFISSFPTSCIHYVLSVLFMQFVHHA